VTAARARGGLRLWLDMERDHDLVLEAAVRSAQDRLVRSGGDLAEGLPRALLDQRGQCLDREHVLEIDRQLVVAVDDQDVARHAALLAQLLDRGEPASPGLGAERLQVLALEPPAAGGEHEAPGSHARPEGQEIERAEVDAGGADLGLQGAEEAVEAEPTGAGEVVSGGEARDDLDAERARAQHHAAAAQREHEVGDRDLLRARDARAAEVRDLVVAQHGAEDDVSQPSLREVDDLGEDGVRPVRLFSAQVGHDVRVQIRVGVAEAAEHHGAGRAPVGSEVEGVVAGGERLRRGGADAHLQLERIRHRSRAPPLHHLEVVVAEGDLLLAARQGGRHQLGEAAVGDVDGSAVLGRRPAAERDAGQERGGLGARGGGAAEADAALLVERLAERHLAALVAAAELLAE